MQIQVQDKINIKSAFFAVSFQMKRNYNMEKNNKIFGWSLVYMWYCGNDHK